MVRSSGNLCLIFINACSICRIETSKICSINDTRILRSTSVTSMPRPIFPDMMKSASASPSRSRLLICLGRLLIKTRFSSCTTFFPRPFRLCLPLFRKLSIFLPCTLPMKRYIESFPIRGRYFSLFRILPAIFRGDCLSYKLSTTNFLRSLFSTIFITWYLLPRLLTYALWVALVASYRPCVRFLRTSSLMVDTDRPSVFAISRREYFFLMRVAISCRSADERCEKLSGFFSYKDYTSVRIQMRKEDP